jgi:hypothetical protein
MCFNLYYKKENYIDKRNFSRPTISIRSHNLHVDDIKRTMGEISSYHHEMRGTNSFPSLVLANYASFDLFLAFLFVFSVMVPSIDFYRFFFSEVFLKIIFFA